jgi:capsular polysaccharide biosynthesis protein
MSFNEQVSTFFYADYIIGEHGSGMFNAIFCKDEAVVFDLFPASVNTTLYRALKSLDIKYIAIQSPEGSMARWSANNSFRVNINFIEKAFNDNGVYANPL